MADEYIQNGKTYVARMDEKKGYRAIFDEERRQCLWFTCESYDGSKLDVLAPDRAIAAKEALDPDREDGLDDIDYVFLTDNDENRAFHDGEIGHLDDVIRRTRPKSVSLTRMGDGPDAGTEVRDENGRTIDAVPFFVSKISIENDLSDWGFAYLEQGAAEFANLSRLEPDEAIALFRKLTEECDRFLGEDLGDLSILTERTPSRQIAAMSRIDEMFRFEMSPDERLLLPRREEIELYGRSMTFAHIAVGSTSISFQQQEDMQKLLAAFGRDDAKRWFFDYAESYDSSRKFGQDFYLAISGYAVQAGLDPLEIGFRLFGEELPKAWVENNATVLQRFQKPGSEGETILFAVPETDPAVLEAGYSARILVSTFSNADVPTGPARIFGRNLAAAYQYANPEIVQDACAELRRDDLARELKAAGLEANEENIDRLASKFGIGEIAERMEEAGSKALREAADGLKAELKAGTERGGQLHEIAEDKERSQDAR